jgi:hypothetical protein
MSASRIALVVSVSCLIQCGGPAAPSPADIGPPELADVIEGIFLGSGPLAAGGCFPRSEVWHSYPHDSTVTVVLSSTIDDRGQATLERAVADLETVLAGRFRLTIGRSLEPDPVPDMLQITSADVPASRIESSCSPGGSGCTTILSMEGPYYLSAQAIQEMGTFQRLKVHELGHAIGLCHVKEERLPSAAMVEHTSTLTATSPTAEGRFSELELEALRAVYASGLEPGATRADFQRVGLVR